MGCLSSSVFCPPPLTRTFVRFNIIKNYNAIPSSRYCYTVRRRKQSTSYIGGTPPPSPPVIIIKKKPIIFSVNAIIISIISGPTCRKKTRTKCVFLICRFPFLPTTEGQIADGLLSCSPNSRIPSGDFSPTRLPNIYPLSTIKFLVLFPYIYNAAAFFFFLNYFVLEFHMGIIDIDFLNYYSHT